MDLYIAICLNRHIDEYVRVFSSIDKAIQCCKEFMSNEDDVKEQELTKDMIDDGWIYYATYGESDSVRVEKRNLDKEA